MTDSSIPYPGQPATADGSTMVAWVETHIGEAACGYPITSSTNMGQAFEASVAAGKSNVWGTPLVFFEPESEHSAASACEGFAAAGGRVTTFTSGQGLVLMKEVLYTIAGKRLPAVFHIGARALTSHSLNVHAGHDDVAAVLDCGWGILMARNAQESADFGLIARRVAENTHTPFMSVEDGFLTTHTVEDVLMPEPEFMKEYVGDPRAKLKNLMDPATGYMSGVVQNQDSYMKGKIAQRAFYSLLEPALEESFAEFSKQTGREYSMLDCHRCEDADFIMIGMGSMMETAQATADWMRENTDMKVGCLSVLSWRPFPGPQIAKLLAGKKAVAVVERLDIPAAQSNPLAAEIKAALYDAMSGAPGYEEASGDMPIVWECSGGLGSRDIRPGDIKALFEHIQQGKPGPAGRFCSLGIKHATAIAMEDDPDVRPDGAFSMRGHSVGGFGSVTTNKVIATLVADIFDQKVQAYPKYGSEKKGLPTTYFLTVAPEHIRTHCELHKVEFVPLNDINAFKNGNPTFGLVEGGTLFMQSPLDDAESVWRSIPEKHRKIIQERKIKLYWLDMVQVAREIASSPDLVVRMQGIVLLGVFLKVTPFAERSGLSHDAVLEGVEDSLRKYFGRRGDKVVAENLECVRRGMDEAREVPLEVIESETTLSV
ncbi:MAG: 2-oxoacid:acceptor oxidoreductase family protein [Planctomycetota bacterium]|nr:2-oxoacid:acceptor oxidoreductase family protein [Planctomycetota bacterium]